MSSFVQDLRPQSLSSLQIYSTCSLDEKMCAALNGHCVTLSDLRLWNVSSEMLLAFPALKDCTSMTMLQLMSDRATTDLETVQGVLSSLIAWLSACKGMKSIIFKNIVGANAWLTPVLLQDDVHLTSLIVEGPCPQDLKAFHKALGNQVTLQSLRLSGGPEQPLWSGGNDSNVFVESICKLKSLSDLQLRDVSDGFYNAEVQELANNLLSLEDLSFSCHFVDGDILPALTGLRNLRRLDVYGLSNFSPKSLTEYIDSLGPGNTRMVLSINAAHWDYGYTEDFQAQVREKMAARVDGKFDYSVARGKHHIWSSLSSTDRVIDPAVEEFDSDSDYA